MIFQDIQSASKWLAYTRSFVQKIPRTDHLYVCILKLLNYALNQETFKNHVEYCLPLTFKCMLKLIADVHLMVNTRIGKYERVSSNGKV